MARKKQAKPEPVPEPSGIWVVLITDTTELGAPIRLIGKGNGPRSFTTEDIQEAKRFHGTKADAYGEAAMACNGRRWIPTVVSLEELLIERENHEKQYAKG
jgi:hypothetical protein